MATRSRRSTGNDNGGVNFNLIHFYDISRLKTELEARGLSTVGKKHELADRLQDAIRNVPQEVPKARPPRKSNTKEKPPEEATIVVKEEPPDEEIPEPKKTPKRARKKEEEKPEIVVKVEEPSEEKETPKKKRKKAEETEEEVPRAKKKKTIEEEGSSKKKSKKSIEKLAEPKEEIAEDVPLLSLLAPKKIKEEPISDEFPGPSHKTTGHGHGTRRATALQNTQPELKSEQKKFIEILGGGDIYDDDNTPDYLPPSPPRKREEEMKVEKVKRREKEEKRKSEVKKQESFRPPKQNLKDAWAQKVAEMRKSQTEQTLEKPQPSQIQKFRSSGEQKNIKSSKAPQTTSSVSVLDDIFFKEDREALEKQKKQEAEEQEAREAERRNKEKMAEYRRKQAEIEARRAEKLKNLPPEALKPKVVPEPKLIQKEAPKLHPYAVPQPLAPGPSVNGETKVLEAPKLIIPPPPPPKKKSSADSSASSTPKVAGPLLPPPPPPKKAIPPPPPPKKINETKETPPEQQKIEKIQNEPKRESPSPEKQTDGEIDHHLVSSITKGFLNYVVQKKANEESSMIVEESAPTLPQEVTVETTLEKREVVVKKEEVEEEPIEEYDPMANTVLEIEAEEYIPSRNQTLAEEDEESEPSDDEVRGEMEDETDSDESDSDEEEPLNTNISPTKRAVESLMQNPRDLLLKANAVVFSSVDENEGGPQIVQMPSAEDYDPGEEERKTPEYHGEPVPSDDEIDFFELAAGIQKPKKRKDMVIEEEKLPSDESIEPDYYNADLHIKGATDKNWQIEPENADGLALMWGGVKSTYGIRLPFRNVRKDEESSKLEEAEKKLNSSKIVFQVKITEYLPMKHLPFEEVDPHDIRVGFSLRSAPNTLGEYPNSYCITSLGKKATNNYFCEFANNFYLNDIITACIDLKEATISYWKNNDYLGVVFSDIDLPEGEAIFPHICIKNCNVAVNFGDFEGDDEDYPWPRNDEWRFMTSLGRGDLERSPKSPESKAQCTIIMMVGLPGAGKTTWVREYLRDHPEEHWTLINTEGVLAAMKVNGISRKRAHHGRWDMVMGLIGKSLQRYVLLAARRRRNYIMDMTNTSRETRKKRLQLFEEFRRKCVIVMPSDEEMLDRQARQARQEGTAIMPPEAMLEMKAVISLPSQELEPFEDIYFIEPPIHRIQECIDQITRYNEEARPWFQKKYKRRRSQMIGLGDGTMPRDPIVPKKPNQPLTVMPQLKVAVVPLDDPSNTAPLSANSSHDSAPTSALGFTMVEDRTPNRPPVHISIDTSVPPPQIVPSTKPLVRVRIEDIPATNISSSFRRESFNRPEEVAPELSEQEMEAIRETAKALNTSGNPMITEAIMRSRLKAMQVKKAEKISTRQETNSSTTPLQSPVIGTPIQVLGGRSIPNISKQISIDTATMGISTNFSPAASGTNSPQIPLASPGLVMNLPPPGLAAPYLSQPRNGLPTTPVQSLPPLNRPPPNFQFPPPSMNIPPPGNSIPSQYQYPPWSQQNTGNQS